MKSFQQFITEAYDSNVAKHVDKDDYELTSITRKPGEGGRIRASRKKTEPEKRRVKAIGGGKTAPAKDYKPRKDIGTNKPRSQREQQPTRERGSAALSAKAAQKKAYLERKKRESATKDEVSGKDKRIDLKKSADKLLTKKTTKAVDPKYTPPKASGLSKAEKRKLRDKGEKKLRDLRLSATGKTKESELEYPITHKEISRRNKLKKQ